MNRTKTVGCTVATPEEFVSKYGGKRVINKILLANNGIAGELIWPHLLSCNTFLYFFQPSNAFGP